MTSDSLVEWRRALIALGVATDEEFVGCSEADIQTLRRSWSVPSLPGLYEEWLRCCGRSAGNTWPGDLMYSRDWDALHAMAERLRSRSPGLLPESVLPFYANPGGEILFFRDLSVHDPTVWATHETAVSEPQEMPGTFSDFLLSAVEASRAHIARGFKPRTLADQERMRGRTINFDSLLDTDEA